MGLTFVFGQCLGLRRSFGIWGRWSCHVVCWANTRGLLGFLCRVVPPAAVFNSPGFLIWRGGDYGTLERQGRLRLCLLKEDILDGQEQGEAEGYHLLHTSKRRRDSRLSGSGGSQKQEKWACFFTARWTWHTGGGTQSTQKVHIGIKLKTTCICFPLFMFYLLSFRGHVFPSDSSLFAIGPSIVRLWPGFSAASRVWAWTRARPRDWRNKDTWQVVYK